MQRSIKAAPTLIYSETDGKPMAETDTHRKFMMAFLQTLTTDPDREPTTSVYSLAF